MGNWQIQVYLDQKSVDNKTFEVNPGDAKANLSGFEDFDDFRSSDNNFILKVKPRDIYGNELYNPTLGL